MASRIDLLRPVFERYAVGDFSASLPLLDPSCVLVLDDAIPDGGFYVGLAGVRDYMTRFLEPWESLTITAIDFREVGDTVVVEVEQRGIGRASQAPSALRHVELWTFRRDTVVHIEVLVDRERALRAAGI